TQKDGILILETPDDVWGKWWCSQGGEVILAQELSSVSLEKKQGFFLNHPEALDKKMIERLERELPEGGVISWIGPAPTIFAKFLNRHKKDAWNRRVETSLLPGVECLRYFSGIEVMLLQRGFP